MATSSICAIADCGKSGRMRRGLCQSHYSRMLKYGDPLKGSVAKGAVWEYLNGVVVPYRGNECLPWPYAKDHGGYGKLTRHGVCHYAHRLACVAVHGEPPSTIHEVAHLCGNGAKGCCNPMHLMWATPKQNKQHKFVHGTMLRGGQIKNAKLNEQNVREIRQLLPLMSMRQIGFRYGVRYHAIAAIRDGKTWRHVK